MGREKRKRQRQKEDIWEGRGKSEKGEIKTLRMEDVTKKRVDYTRGTAHKNISCLLNFIPSA